ncbi:Avirulence (Avh) protein [Phytophthora megakarya]|uniref:Avirulence (Avh) protein n=1 Tax=Phytophthora megakarya TaxID=4795 RepID=A0A225WFC4_9STRA|nr:Avirulence (Avh) protein [Phytophthora megakarya]
MRTRRFQIAAVTIIFVSCVIDIIATSDANQANLVLEDSDIPDHGDAKRYLRTSKIIEAEEDREDTNAKAKDQFDDEIRGNLDFAKHASLKQLDDLSTDLAKVPGVVKFVKGEQTDIFKQIAAQKWTPESMAETLNIASKLKTMSKAKLKRDPEFLLWEYYTKFWNVRKAQA